MPLLEIVIVLLLTLINGGLAMSEMAIVSSRKARLESMAKQAGSGARIALELIADPSHFLSTVQIGITLVGIFAGAYGGATLSGPLAELLRQVPMIAPYADGAAITIVVVGITYLSLVVGELVPKRIALANPERTASVIAPPMRLLSRIAAPAVWLLRHSTDGLLRLLGLYNIREAAVTEEEVRSLIAEGTRTGIFEPQERKMIEGVLRIADRTVRAIMTKRPDIVWIDKDADPEALVALVKETRHTEFLVCEGAIDKALGLISTRDMLKAVLDGKPIDIAGLMGRSLFVAEQTPVLKLIDLFRRQGLRTAVVVDEYGATQGIVTATDVLEGVAGALPDQGDRAEPMLVQRPDGSWLADGLIPVDEFRDLCGISDMPTDGDYDTLAGFIIDQLGHLPKTGDRVAVGDLTLEVVDMDGRRIDKVLATLSKESYEG